jgi:seryl-tRNA synthetase
MLDIKFIRENAEAIQQAADNKNIVIDMQELLKVDRKRVKLMQEIEGLQAEKNNLNQQMKLAQSDEERQEIIAQGKIFKNQLEEKEPILKEIQKQFKQMMVKVPTITASDVPVGKDESENVVVYEKAKSRLLIFSQKLILN